MLIDRDHVGVHQASRTQFPQHEARPAGLLELVHIGAAVRVHARQQGHHRGQLGEVGPVDQQACRACHRHPVDEVVGGSARGQQGRHGVDDAALIDQTPDGGEARARAHQAEHLTDGVARQTLTQAVVGVHKGGTRNVQAHGLQEHLVAVGGAVERAGAGAVVSLALHFQQGLTPHQTLGRLLTHTGLLLVGQARAHGPGRHEHAGQMPEVQCPDQQARHDLVAHAQQQGSVEHVMRQGHRGGHGDGVAREQAQFHARLALGDAIAHGRNATRHLGRGPQAPRLIADQGRVGLVGLVRRQHVVVGRDHANVGRLLHHDAELVLRRHGRKRMGDIGTAHAVGASGESGHPVKPFQIGRTQRVAALAYALRHGADDRVQQRPRAFRGAHEVTLEQDFDLSPDGTAGDDDRM